MDWEGDPDTSRRYGRLGTVIAIAVVVAVVAWLARSPATTPDQLAVDAPTSPDAVTPSAPEVVPPLATLPPADAEPVDLLDLDAVLPVRSGEWTQIPPGPPAQGPPLDPHPPATADRPGGPPPAHVWDGDELIVLSGRDGHALDPTAGTWREVPGYPGNPSAIKGPTVLRRGIVVVDLLVGPEPGAISSGAMWLLRPEGVWDPLPRPPTDQVWSVADHAQGIVATGRIGTRDPGDQQDDVPGADPPPADGAWLLPDGGSTWAALPALPQALDMLRAFDTSAGLVVLGVAAPPDLDRNIIAAGELGAAAYLLDPTATGWHPLADPPDALAGGSQAVAAATAGSPPDRVLLLEATDPRDALRLHVYDVWADEWSVQALDLPPGAAATIGGLPWLATSDGEGTAWFTPVSQSHLLLALDVATGRLDLVVPLPRAPTGILPIAFPGGLLLAGGVSLDAEGVPTWSARIDRWTPSPPQ